MHSEKLIAQLLKIKRKSEHFALLKKHKNLLGAQFAIKLKNTYYDSWTKEPQKTRNAATALEALTKILPDIEIKALAEWVKGIAALTNGKIEQAVADLDASAAIFSKIGQEHNSAQTQVAKLIALALLGKYEDSVKTGEKALKTFEKFHDELAAGKIEMNLSNVVSRRGQHRKAEKYCLSALKRFENLGEKTWAVMAKNGLANTYAELNNFRQAEFYYAEALKTARSEKMYVTEAEIEASMGNLAIFRGRFHDALRFLELSRQKYEALKIPHQTSIAEFEIANIYLELNLSKEASTIYKKVVRSLHKLKLQGEEAQARANFARAALLNKQTRKALNELKKSAKLFVLEKNKSGAAEVKISEAHLELCRQKYESSLKIIIEARKLTEKTENPRRKLFAKWLHGEILLHLKRYNAAAKILGETLTESEKTGQANLTQLCLNSLGNVAFRKDERRTAEIYFKRAVRMVETLRAPIPAEEFRMAFLSDKLAPFENLAKIYLAENDLAKAFTLIEKARARTLSENLNGRLAAQDEKPSQLSKKLEELREELNWFYSRLNRAEKGDFEFFQKEAKKREKLIAEVMRQIASTRIERAEVSANRRNFSGKNGLRFLQNNLKKKRKILVEFVSFDGVLSAFVISAEKIDFIRGLATEAEVLTLLEGLQFQFGTMRYGARNVGEFNSILKNRADLYLQKLYKKLILPLEKFIAGHNLIIVPVGTTHYVPFHALHTGEEYLIEAHEVVYAPSATVWQVLNARTAKKSDKALLIGFADEKIPLVNQEIAELAKIFPNAEILIDDDATFSNFTNNASKATVLHLACHGQFRSDNPLFSSLQLADGSITVRDICSQKLQAEIVTLSACETGLNEIFAGDEILGLTRGFLAAGANSLILSLWTVNDAAATRLMKDFYSSLQRGTDVSASLRTAQINFIKNDSHPYFWSPFMAIGK